MIVTINNLSEEPKCAEKFEDVKNQSINQANADPMVEKTVDIINSEIDIVQTEEDPHGLKVIPTLKASWS